MDLETLGLPIGQVKAKSSWKGGVGRHLRTDAAAAGWMQRNVWWPRAVYRLFLKGLDNR